MHIEWRNRDPQSNEGKTPGRVLVVDDDVWLLEVIAGHLRTEGYDVDTATEAEEAEALLANYTYSLVITDLALSRFGFRGLELLEYTWEICHRPKIIVLTNHTDAAIQAEATARGVDKFMAKPVRLRQLSQVTAQLLGATA